MTSIHRRAMLGVMLGGAAAATMGIAVLTPGPAESAPLTMAAGRAVETENPVEKAVWVRRRVRVCSWHRDIECAAGAVCAAGTAGEGRPVADAWTSATSFEKLGSSPRRVFDWWR
jgi:hypothetical protein